MKDILEDIIACKRQEVAAQKSLICPASLHAAVERQIENEHAMRASAGDGAFAARCSMRQSLAHSDFGIIAEFKRRSPSKGWIKESGRPDIIPADYAENGASAVSILTDEKFFGGTLDFIRIARPAVTVPILRKDFVIDEYQLFQARWVGADAVLLIAADLSKPECRQLIETAHKLELEVLLEIHADEELDYAELGPDMLGVNNRNLGSFHTDVENSYRLAERLPKDMLRVSESGISNPATIRRLRKAGFRGFLMGEHFMRAANPGAALKEFIEELKE